MTKPATILHISDLHFTSKGVVQKVDDRVKDPALSKASSDDQGAIFTVALKRHLEKLREKGSKEEYPKAIVVSGDLVDRGGVDKVDGISEFDKATEFLKGLADLLSLREQYVYVVPGNHDVDWTPGLTQRQRFEPFMNAMATAGFTHPTFGTDGHPHPKIVEDLCDIRSGISVELALLISPTFSGAEIGDPEEIVRRFQKVLDALGEGEISSKIKEAIINQSPVDIALLGSFQRNQIATWASAPDRMRVAVMHHHLLPDPEVDLSQFEAVIDSGRLMQTLLSAGFDLALTGHRHNRRLIQYKDMRHRMQGSEGDGQLIDVYSCPSLFKQEANLATPGPTFIDFYGANHPYYAKIRTCNLDMAGQVLVEGNGTELYREGRIIPKLQTACAEANANIQQGDLLPIVEQVVKGLEWPLTLGIERLPELVRSVFDSQIKRDLYQLSSRKLVIRSSDIQSRWTELLDLADPREDELRLSSSGEMKFWAKLANKNSPAFKYDEPVAGFQGKKSRCLVLTKEQYEENVETWKKIIYHMREVTGLTVNLVDRAQLETDTLNFCDFGLVGGIFVTQGYGDSRSPFGRSIQASFNQEDIRKAEEVWGELNSKEWFPE